VANICNRCHKNKTRKGMKQCDKCNKDRMDTYNYYKSLGICVNCRNEEALYGQVCCEICAEKDIKNKTEKIKKLKESGNYDQYKQHRNDLCKIRAKKRREAGLCEYCGKYPPEDGYKRCYKCLIKMRQKLKKRGLKISRSARPSFGMCYICGEPLYKDYKVCEKHYTQFVENIRNTTSPIESHPWRMETKSGFIQKRKRIAQKIIERRKNAK